MTETPAPAPEEGWTAPTLRATRVHYFRDGRSLCGRYGLPHHRRDHLEPDNGQPSDSDCAACARKLRAGQ